MSSDNREHDLFVNIYSINSILNIFIRGDPDENNVVTSRFAVSLLPKTHGDIIHS